MTFSTIEWITLASLFFSGALVAVTVIYTYFTKKQTEETQQTRKTNVKPSIKAGIDFLGPGNIYFFLENIGKAAAKDVRAEWTIAGITKEWEILVFSPGERYKFLLIVTEDDESLTGIGDTTEYIEKSNRDSTLEYEVTCQDILNEEKKFSGGFNVLEQIESRIQAREFQTKEELTKIREELADAGDAIDDLKKVMEDFTDRDLARVKISEKILEILESQGPIKLSDLTNLTGISKIDLIKYLDRLKDSGEIKIVSGEKSLLQADSEKITLDKKENITD